MPAGAVGDAGGHQAAMPAGAVGDAGGHQAAMPAASVRDEISCHPNLTCMISYDINFHKNCFYPGSGSKFFSYPDQDILPLLGPGSGSRIREPYLNFLSPGARK
jgi:hypothetical protein